jgi:hypothetical protein
MREYRTNFIRKPASVITSLKEQSAPDKTKLMKKSYNMQGVLMGEVSLEPFCFQVINEVSRDRIFEKGIT